MGRSVHNAVLPLDNSMLPDREARRSWGAIMALWPNLEAVVAGKACWRKREPAEPWSEETKDAYDRLVAEFDSIHKRLTAANKPL
jgi:hypothetical protein